ncbi:MULTISPECIES: cytochrome c [unclassified Bradyrhizobium]|uniref:cytochrome c n=1 Tax=unclassified Bradyrhizobium TaxID=2631580 RepID=UPI0003FE9DA7|nr:MULTISPECIES: cytochrome c [unclassified Bradyrhizobium]MCP3465057.1 cytochrome c [Bradyrhizobium sp. CCGUVB23]
MKRTIIVVGALLLGAGAVMAQQEIAVQQDNLMRSQAKSLYDVIQKMSKGNIPYNQKAVDQALADLEQSVAKIAKTFEVNPKEDVVNATYGASQKVWQNKADFDSKIPPVQKAIADAKGKVHNVATLKAAYTSINDRCSDCHETYRVKLK